MNKLTAIAFASLSLITVNAEPLTLQVMPQQQARSCCALTSISDARDQIRELKSSGNYPQEGIIVELAAGTYNIPSTVEFDNIDSGTDAAPIIYRAAKDAEVVITGGLIIEALENITDQQVLAQLPEAARAHVKAYTLNEDSDHEIPGFSSGGAGFLAEKEYSYELYQASLRQPLARWPNHGYAKIGEVIGEKLAYKDRKDILTCYSGVFEFNEPQRLARWANEPDMWLDGKWYHHWADQRMQLESIDTDAGTIALKNPESHAYGFKENRDFYVFNALSELDTPGEWVIDRTKRILYIWPAIALSETPLQLSRNKTLIHTNQLENVRFEQLTFQNTTGDAIILDNSQNVQIVGCTIEQTGGWGVIIEKGYNCKVIDSDLSQLGEGGCRLNGGKRDTLTPSGHIVENCKIHDFSQVVSTYRPAVQLHGVGAQARHNLIYNTPHTALAFDGNDHLIEYNILHDVALHASDTGGIYSCARDWSKRGTIIRYNLVHALGEALDGAGCRAIYLDDHTSGVTIAGNITTMSSIGIHIGGGKYNHVTNNLILNCDVSIDYASRGIDSFAAVDARRGVNSTAYAATYRSPWQTALWQERYPELADIFTMDPIEANFASDNEITNNVMAGGSDIRIQNADYVMQTSLVTNNALISGDPGLVDREHLNFNLSPSDKTQEAKNYKSIPFNKFGLYASSQRPTPATKFGPEVSELPEIRTLEAFSKARQSAFIDIKRSTDFTINGLRDDNEWTGRFDHRTKCKVSAGENSSAFNAYSQVAYDGEAFYIYANIEHDTESPLVMNGKWGMRDGYEIGLQDPRNPKAPTILIQCYPDGTFEVVKVGKISQQQVKSLTEAITYAANCADGVWTTEMRLPLHALDISTAELSALDYNINVRRMADNSWMMWARPMSNFWELQNAGLLKMPSF